MMKDLKLNGLIEFNGVSIPVRNDYFYVSDVMNLNNKRISNWLKSKSTKEYIKALDDLDRCNNNYIADLKRVITSKGGEERGETRIHNSLIIAFARWIDPKFAVKCDRFIYDNMIKLHEQKIMLEKENEWFWKREDIHDLYKH